MGWIPAEPPCAAREEMAAVLPIRPGSGAILIVDRTGDVALGPKGVGG